MNFIYTRIFWKPLNHLGAWCINPTAPHEKTCCHFRTVQHTIVFFTNIYILYMWPWPDIMQLLTTHWSPYLLPHQSRHVMVTPSTECHIPNIRSLYLVAEFHIMQIFLISGYHLKVCWPYSHIYLMWIHQHSLSKLFRCYLAPGYIARGYIARHYWLSSPWL